jgi:hypothetical protein
VRRLVRDGVDVPLANLFVAAARPIASDGQFPPPDWSDSFSRTGHLAFNND